MLELLVYSRFHENHLAFGWNAGVRKSLLVRTGYGAEVERTDADKLTRAVVVDGIPLPPTGFSRRNERFFRCHSAARRLEFSSR